MHINLLFAQKSYLGCSAFQLLLGQMLSQIIRIMILSLKYSSISQINWSFFNGSSVQYFVYVGTSKYIIDFQPVRFYNPLDFPTKYQLPTPHFKVTCLYFSGNGRIKVSGIYKDWRPASWSHKLGTTQLFPMNQGTITISQSGLYMLYAQVSWIQKTVHK